MKKILLTVVALLGLAGLATLSTQSTELNAANATSLNQPGDAGRPQSDSVTSARVEWRLARGIGDCSDGASASPTSPTSTPINLSSVAGLSWAANKYAGLYILEVTNAGTASVVVYYNRTATAITTSTPAGDVIAAGSSAEFPIQARDGMTAHLQGLSATCSKVNYSVCTN